MMQRRQLLKWIGLAPVANLIPKSVLSFPESTTGKAVVLSTWYNQSVSANVEAWKVIQENGTALDAVIKGVMVSENDINNCCVGLGGNPDREGIVTLDASVMDHQFNCGAVAALEQIQNPILVAKMIMEKTPHVLLVGEGAQKFALENGFVLKSKELSDHADRNYKEWLKKSDYHPAINIEKNKVPNQLNHGEYNHDTIGMIALDNSGNLSGACTTSGLGYKMRGRVGDSPIIGAGLYVDNKIGAATATGNGEEVIRISGAHLVVELMRQGFSPATACKKAVERILTSTPRKLSEIQIGFIAINKAGEYGGYALNKGFDYGVSRKAGEVVKVEPKFLNNAH